MERGVRATLGEKGGPAAVTLTSGAIREAVTSFRRSRRPELDGGAGPEDPPEPTPPSQPRSVPEVDNRDASGDPDDCGGTVEAYPHCLLAADAVPPPVPSDGQRRNLELNALRFMFFVADTL